MATTTETAKTVMIAHDPEIIYSKTRDGHKIPIYCFTTADLAHNLRRGRGEFIVKTRGTSADGTTQYGPLMLNYSDKGLGKVRLIFGEKSPKESIVRRGAKQAEYIISVFNDTEEGNAFNKAVEKHGEVKARMLFREYDLQSDLDVINAAISTVLQEHADFKYSRYAVTFNSKRNYNAKLPKSTVRKIEEEKVDPETKLVTKSLIQREESYDLNHYINLPGKVQFELGSPYFMAGTGVASDTMMMGPVFSFLTEKYLPAAIRDEIERAKAAERESAKTKKEKELSKTAQKLQKARGTFKETNKTVAATEVSAETAAEPDFSGSYHEYAAQFIKHCAALEDVEEVEVVDPDYVVEASEDDQAEDEEDEEAPASKRSRV